MIQIAFYKGKGNWFDKLIRWWTKSPYSHCELIIDGVWYSSSPRDGGVRKKRIESNNCNWDYVNLEIDDNMVGNMVQFLNDQIGKGYDWTGILLSQVLPLAIENPNRWFCSELISEVLGTTRSSQWYSPERLYNEIAWK